MDYFRQKQLLTTSLYLNTYQQSCGQVRTPCSPALQNIIHCIFVQQNIEINNNDATGVILSAQSLVLQRVTRAAAGDYTCMAANSEGKGTSNPVTLLVRCKYYRHTQWVKYELKKMAKERVELEYRMFCTIFFS